MPSSSNQEFKVLSMDEVNKLSEDDAREYLINLLNSIPGMKYGHIYEKDEVKWMKEEYTKQKNERIARNENTETEYETKLRYHLSYEVPENTNETITDNLKSRVRIPENIVCSWAIYHDEETENKE